MTATFYRRVDENVFDSTQNTAGPWSADSQHGGPPAALLGRALQAAGGREDVQVARATFEILKPVPVARLQISTEVVRPGKNVDLVEATLRTEGEPVIKATAWRIRTSELPLDAPDTRPPPVHPDDLESVDFFWTDYDSYMHAMEWRFEEPSERKPGRAQAWVRMRMPLLEDETDSPLTRVLISADSGSGISAALDWKEWLFINTDLTVNLHRLPEGEWIRMDATSLYEPHGVGLASTEISDVSGPVGRGAQSLYITRRRHKQ